jgi:hypothetical protein
MIKTGTIMVALGMSSAQTALGMKMAHGSGSATVIVTVWKL